MNGFKIKVKCYSGYRGEETPQSIFLDDKEIKVKKVLEMWLAPTHRYFKILGSDEEIYIIRYDEEK
ncbi:MAG: hypothetical protein KAR45_06530, partial [Desulfobacteraceae bacterium]|nr:hypothetical protein [Desulfobacteraceae bacterium]